LDKICPLLKPEKILGLVMTLMLPATAVSQSLAQRLVRASWIVAMLDEQVVSILNDGPENLK
jgi:hypothetical protein